VQPELPTTVQFPVIAFPVIVPFIVSVFPPGDPDTTFIPNDPDTFPLKFPLNENEPVPSHRSQSTGNWSRNEDW